MYNNIFWSDFETTIITNLNLIVWFMLCFELHGLSKKWIFMIYLLIIFRKFHICNCKWSNLQSCSKVFHLDFKLNDKTLEYMGNMKTTRTFYLLRASSSSSSFLHILFNNLNLNCNADCWHVDWTICYMSFLRPFALYVGPSKGLWNKSLHVQIYRKLKKNQTLHLK